MEPATVMTCVQVASSVASMLAPKGPSVTDLIAIQTEMIKNISNQINVLQKGIDTIIRKIDELKEFVEYDLPSKIYREFLESDMIGSFGAYQEGINAYFFDRPELGCLVAYNAQRGKLIKSLEQIQETRRKLLNNQSGKDYFLSPLVANCFKIEMDLMILLYKDFVTNGNFNSTFMVYENWLIEMQNPLNSYSVDFHINQLKTKYDECFPNSFGYSLCKLVDNFREDEKPLNLGKDEYFNIDLHVQYYQFKRFLHPSVTNELVKYSLTEKSIEVMYTDLNIDKSYFPSVLSQTVENKIDEEVIKLHFHDDYYEGIPGDGDPPSVSIAKYYNPKLNIDRDFLHFVKKCENTDGKIFTNSKYYDSSKAIENLALQIIVPISNKKIMFDIQQKINFLKSKLN